MISAFQESPRIITFYRKVAEKLRQCFEYIYWGDIMTEGMMNEPPIQGYNPRSESSEMFRGNHEDEPPTGMQDAKDRR